MTIAGVIQGDLPGQAALREWVQARAAYWANPPYGPCETPGCLNSHLDVLLGQDDPRCGECRRRTAVRHQAEMFYPCDVCESPTAFRDPAHRRDEYLCLKHHRDNGYEPGERAMLTKVAKRMGVTHSMGRKPLCILRGSETQCGGEVKHHSGHGEICARHWDPKKYLANKGV